MAYRCPNEDCAYPEAGKCVLGFEDPETQCIKLRSGRETAGAGALAKASPSVPPPLVGEMAEVPGEPKPSETLEAAYDGNFWSGGALGADEAASMLGDPRTLLFTIVGGKDRGKTCLLTAFYIQLANGFTGNFPYRFCGSQSLRGFQLLTDPAFKWKGDEERIVPRTTQSSFRQPSFLHFALKPAAALHGAARHVLLTDMPGEWFERWVGQGTRSWKDTLEFLPRSDGIVLTLDAQELCESRIYRNDMTYLVDRLLAVQREHDTIQRPLAIVLTKYDQVAKKIPIPGPNKNDPGGWGALAPALRNLCAVLEGLPQVAWEIFPCAAFSRPSVAPLGAFEPFAFLLEHTTRQSTVDPIVLAPRIMHRFFSVFREDCVR